MRIFLRQLCLNNVRIIIFDHLKIREVAQLGRVLGWGSSGRRFKSCLPDTKKRLALPSRFFMQYKVYILRSLKNQRHYTGISIDIARRLSEHNASKTKSTRPHTPYELIWNSEFMSHSDALKLEIKIKRKGAAKYLGQIL